MDDDRPPVLAPPSSKLPLFVPGKPRGNGARTPEVRDIERRLEQRRAARSRLRRDQTIIDEGEP